MNRVELSRGELAINGGTPLRTADWIDNITTGEEEKQAVLRVLDSGYLSLFEGSHTPDHPFSFRGGPEVQALEDEWCQYYGTPNAISVNSATSGLYAAVGALGIGYGDEVIVSPYTMSACALAPLIYGAIPVFADVELDSGSLDPKSIEARITERTRAILVVHQFGVPADMDAIMAIARKHDLKVIEDCAQAHGARYGDDYVGTMGDIGVFSLNVNKTIQSGEGGVCICKDDELAYRLQLIRNHGEAVVDAAEYKSITNIAGYNYRLSELHAAVAREQLKKLDGFNARRLDYVEALAESFSQIGFLRPIVNRVGCHSTFYIFPMRFDEGLAGISREQFVDAVNAEGALFYQGYVKPLYLQSIYQQKRLFKHHYPFSAPENADCSTDYSLGSCPNAEQLHFKEMLINEHVRLPQSMQDMHDLVAIVQKVAGGGA